MVASGATAKGGKVKNYFQFPLCLLAYLKHEHGRLSAIIDYNVVNYAKKKLGSTKRDAIYTAAEVLGVNYRNTPGSHIVQRWKEASEFVERFEMRHGKDARVRIASSLLWDCYKGKLPYREFCMLCALNSILGKTTGPKRVTQPSIRVRAAGYKSWDALRADIPKERWPEILLSEDKVRYGLKKLYRRGFFDRARTGARTVLYMVGSGVDIRAKIIEREKRNAEKARHAEKDRQLRALIKEIRRPAINVGKASPINDGKSEQKTSRHNPDTVPDMIPDMVTDINKSSLIEAFNESVPNECVPNSACAPGFSFFQKDGNLPRTPKPLEAVLEVRYKLKGSTKIFSQEEANRLFADNNALEFERLHEGAR
jgi:hypothetical protein